MDETRVSKLSVRPSKRYHQANGPQADRRSPPLVLTRPRLPRVGSRHRGHHARAAPSSPRLPPASLARSPPPSRPPSAKSRPTRREDLRVQKARRRAGITSEPQARHGRQQALARDFSRSSVPSTRRATSRTRSRAPCTSAGQAALPQQRHVQGEGERQAAHGEPALERRVVFKCYTAKVYTVEGAIMVREVRHRTNLATS